VDWRGLVGPYLRGGRWRHVALPHVALPQRRLAAQNDVDAPIRSQVGQPQLRVNVSSSLRTRAWRHRPGFIPWRQQNVGWAAKRIQTRPVSGQLQVGSGDILFEVHDGGRARDSNDIRRAMQKPGERHLSSSDL